MLHKTIGTAHHKNGGDDNVGNLIHFINRIYYLQFSAADIKSKEELVMRDEIQLIFLIL